MAAAADAVVDAARVVVAWAEADADDVAVDCVELSWAVVVPVEVVRLVMALADALADAVDVCPVAVPVVVWPQAANAATAKPSVDARWNVARRRYRRGYDGWDPPTDKVATPIPSLQWPLTFSRLPAPIAHHVGQNMKRHFV